MTPCSLAEKYAEQSSVLAVYLLVIFFGPEDWGSMFRRNVYKPVEMARRHITEERTFP
jgi:hypothetical protein